MDLIVCVDRNWGIGSKGQLLCPISADLQRFKQLTLGKTILYGDKTMATFPHGKPLPKRENIVLAADPAFTVEGATVVHSLEELLALVNDKEDVYVAGGASVYRQLLPYCHLAYVTHLSKAFPADAWFPDLSQKPEWQLREVSEEYPHEDFTYRFSVYENSSLF